MQLPSAIVRHWKALMTLSEPEAEARMAEMQENAWDVLADSELTADQQDAVLCYINAKKGS